eukprot:gene15479-biopygen15571
MSGRGSQKRRRSSLWTTSNHCSFAMRARLKSCQKVFHSPTLTRRPASMIMLLGAGNFCPNPTNETGCPGVASCSGTPDSSRIFVTRIKSSPAMTFICGLKTPRLTITDTELSPSSKVGCRPGISADAFAFVSNTTASARQGVGVTSSRTSACRRTDSSRLLMPCPVFAEIAADITSPPMLSSWIPYSNSSFPTLLMRWSTLSATRSAFVKATTTGKSSRLISFTTSILCGLSPSLIAITRITRSVALAPASRMDSKASWPGVSMKVMGVSCPGTATRNAPMACVIPPASPFATSDFRRVSRSVVLPWSTWPITVTTGGLATYLICSGRGGGRPRALMVSQTDCRFESLTMRERLMASWYGRRLMSCLTGCRVGAMRCMEDDCAYFAKGFCRGLRFPRSCHVDPTFDFISRSSCCRALGSSRPQSSSRTRMASDVNFFQLMTGGKPILCRFLLIIARVVSPSMNGRRDRPRRTLSASSSFSRSSSVE